MKELKQAIKELEKQMDKIHQEKNAEDISQFYKGYLNGKYQGLIDAYLIVNRIKLGEK